MTVMAVLDNPVIWELSRIGLNVAFGLYRKGMRVMHEWGVLKGHPSVLDIGCGIGQYSEITEGEYLGVDLNHRWIKYARRRHRRPNQVFRGIDVTALAEEQRGFDLVLMVDFLHHLSEKQCVTTLSHAQQLAQQHVVSFEPISYQPHRVGRWIVENDRGKYVRPFEKLLGLFEESRLTIVKAIEFRLGPINTTAILASPPIR